MSDELFRREAIEFSTQRLYGRVVVRPRVSHLAALVFLLAVLGLLVAALANGVSVRRQTVAGTLRVEAGGEGTAELRLPPRMAAAIEPGRDLSLRIGGFLPGLVGEVPGRVVRVSAPHVTLPTPGRVDGTVYVPVVVSVARVSLRQAGLPLTTAAELPVETTLVVARKAWWRWLVEAVTRAEDR